MWGFNIALPTAAAEAPTSATTPAEADAEPPSDAAPAEEAPAPTSPVVESGLFERPTLGPSLRERREKAEAARLNASKLFAPPHRPRLRRRRAEAAVASRNSRAGLAFCPTSARRQARDATPAFIAWPKLGTQHSLIDLLAGRVPILSELSTRPRADGQRPSAQALATDAKVTTHLLANQR